MKDPEGKADQVYAELVRYLDERGYPPSRRELADAVGVSLSCIQDALALLQRRGRIRVHPSIARGVMVAGPEGFGVQ